MASPEMSVVLVTPDGYQRLRKVMAFLARQTVSAALEIVIVSPQPLPDPSDPCWARFSAVKLVSTGPFLEAARPRAVAVSHCSASVVAFGEDHCFPEPDWAEILIRCHAGGWAAVAPALRNGNPGPVSWADCLLNFGLYINPGVARNVQTTPWHNTSYKRDFLNAYGDRLEGMLEVELRIHSDLARNGQLLFLAANTSASHVNISRWRSFLLGQFVGGRLYGNARSEAGGWSIARRLFYASMLPLIPLRRAPMVMRDAKRSMPEGWSFEFLLACVCGLAASALGETSGYVLGPGSMGWRRITFEYERERHVSSRDLRHLSASGPGEA
jgi:hypothetical protein